MAAWLLHMLTTGSESISLSASTQFCSQKSPPVPPLLALICGVLHFGHFDNALDMHSSVDLWTQLAIFGLGVVDTATTGVGVATAGVVVVVAVVGVVVVVGFTHFEGSKATFFDIHEEPLLRVSSVIALHH
jgi:hypothetical protein